MSKVIVYSTPVCPNCRLVKQFLINNHVDFIDKDVTSDPEAMRLFDSEGFTSVPITQVDDEFVFGFDEVGLRKALGLKS